MPREGVRMNKREIILDAICFALGFAAFYLTFYIASAADAGLL